MRIFRRPLSHKPRSKSSVVTSKPANGGQVKTGQWMEGAKPSLF
jgi:hypothetical protein